MMKEFSREEKNNILQTLEKLFNQISIETQYFDSYFEFLKYFENLEIIDKHSLTIGAYFTYGWMPTIPKIQISQEAIDIANKAKHQIDLESRDYLNLLKCINNSIVGTSKLLHFINPYQYPIFDSRIKSFFEKNHLIWKIYSKTYNDKNKEIEQYLLYKTLCEELIEMIEFKKLSQLITQKYPITAKFTEIRMLENLFFSFDKNSK